jgi:RimJ/RimL family protein N-acetyltransferase
VTILETARFRLVPPTADDVASLTQHWRRPEVRKYLWDDAMVGLDTVKALVASSVDDHARDGWGGWIITTRDVNLQDRLVGWCGLHLGPPDGSAASDVLVELVYSLEPLWWGTGAVVEAATAVLDHVFTATALEEVFAGFDGPNVRSAATLQRLGFEPNRVVLLDIDPTQYWRVGRASWAPRRPGGQS